MRNPEHNSESKIRLTPQEKRALFQLVQTELTNPDLSIQYRQLLQGIMDQVDGWGPIVLNPETAQAIAHLVNKNMRIIQDADHQTAYKGIKRKLQNFF